MKRILIKIAAGLIVCAMGLGLAACGHPDQIEGVGPEGAADAANTEEIEDGLITGSMDVPSSYAVDQQEEVLFNEALQGYVEGNIAPVAYLGSQIVAGTNHCFMCRYLDSIPDARETFAFVRIYEDLNGKAVLRDVRDSHIETNLSDNAGGWQLPESPDLSEELSSLCRQALEEGGRSDCEPLCCLAQQVVAGMNYRIFCRTEPESEGAETGYVVATIYQDLQGKGQLTDLVDFQIETGN